MGRLINVIDNTTESLIKSKQPTSDIIIHRGSDFFGESFFASFTPAHLSFVKKKLLISTNSCPKNKKRHCERMQSENRPVFFLLLLSRCLKARRTKAKLTF